MKFSQLPPHLRLNIARATFDIDKLDDLTPEQINNLDLDSPQELFARWLQWEGILGYTDRLIETWETIKGPALTRPQLKAVGLLINNLEFLLDKCSCGALDGATPETIRENIMFAHLTIREVIPSSCMGVGGTPVPLRK